MQGRVRREDFQLLQGADLVEVYAEPGFDTKAFCRRCGSSLFGGTWPDGDEVSIRFGALDGDPGIRPQYHVYVASKAAWHAIMDDLPQRSAGEMSRHVPVQSPSRRQDSSRIVKHTIELPVQFRDLDVLGHVNSGTFIQYMETARVDLVARMVPQAVWYRVPFIVASVRCEYVEAISEDESVEVNVWTSRLGGRSWDFDYTVSARGRVCARGRTTQVGFDHESRCVAEPGQDLRRMLEKFVGDPLQFRG